MFSKFGAALSKDSINLENLFSGIDFEKLQKKSEGQLNLLFSSIDESAKREIMDWFKAAKDIKSQVELSNDQKHEQLLALKTNKTLLNVLSAVIEVLAEKAPSKSQGLLKVGLKGVGMAAAVLNFEVGAVAMIAFNKALPSFVMSSHFESFQVFIEKNLQRNVTSVE